MTIGYIQFYKEKYDATVTEVIKLIIEIRKTKAPNATITEKIKLMRERELKNKLIIAKKNRKIAKAELIKILNYFRYSLSGMAIKTYLNEKQFLSSSGMIASRLEISPSAPSAPNYPAVKGRKPLPNFSFSRANYTPEPEPLLDPNQRPSRRKF